MWRCMGLEVFLLTACPSVDIFVQLHWADVCDVLWTRDQLTLTTHRLPPAGRSRWPRQVCGAARHRSQGAQATRLRLHTAHNAQEQI